MPTLERKALSTFGGGISGMVAMMPFDYIKSWQQADRNKTSAMTISKSTLKKLGIKGFFRGLRYNIPECFALGWFSYWQAQSEEPSSQQNELEKNTQEPSYLQKKI